MCETRHDPQIEMNLRNEAKHFGKYQGCPMEVLFGHPAPMEQGWSSGIAMIAGGPAAKRVRRVKPPAGIWAEEFEEIGRLALFCVTVQGERRHKNDRGETNLYLFICYGEVQNPEEANRLLRVIQTWLERLNPRLALVCGDFNLEVEESPTLVDWQQGRLMHDVFWQFAKAVLQEPPGTSKKGQQETD